MIEELTIQRTELARIRATVELIPWRAAADRLSGRHFDYVVSGEFDTQHSSDATAMSAYREREDIADLLAPITCKYFAATIESDRTLPDDMNSGVMWMHLPEMANVDERFREFVCENIDELPGSSWDQGAYRKFFRAADGARLWDDIPLELNWKPYWEENPQARIIHFHGPKPFHRKYIRSHFPELEHFTGGCYSVLCDAWENLLYEANR